jgi:hypothetical protein
MGSCLKCQKPLAEPRSKGRRRVYCSMPCRRLGEAERRRITRELARLQARRSEILGSPWGSPEGRQRAAFGIDAELVTLEARLRLLYAEAEK